MTRNLETADAVAKLALSILAIVSYAIDLIEGKVALALVVLSLIVLMLAVIKLLIHRKL